ncbi:hypothetical protein [Halomonas salinarum]|uniref:hypothetical protein n=1 Tax=Halomonas salinarum TaxID=1158993 RepID=UPI00143A73D8|nr:hypothetical protein [Halomonas salinarum]
MKAVGTPVLLADGETLSAAMLRQLFIGQCLVLGMHLAVMPLWLMAVAALVAWRRHRQLIERAPRAGVAWRCVWSRWRHCSSPCGPSTAASDVSRRCSGY